jgi:hypothetical protein
MDRALRWLWRSLLGLVLTVPLAAQENSCLHRTLPFNILDSRMRLIRISDASYFQGKLGRAPVKILSVSRDNRPRRIVIMLDTSGSMLGDPPGRKWQLAQFVAAHIAKAKLPNNSLALLLFSDQVNQEVDFSEGDSAVERRLLEIEADANFAKKQLRGKTALRDAVLSALRLLCDPGYANSIYIITDGGDNESRNRFQQVRDDLVRSGVRLYVTLLTSVRLMPDEQSGLIEVAELAKDSGGLVLGPVGGQPFGRVSNGLTKDELRRIAIRLDELYLVMTTNDLMGIELPQSVKKWSKWTLEISKEQKSAHKDWLLAYPQEVAPCVAATSSH